MNRRTVSCDAPLSYKQNIQIYKVDLDWEKPKIFSKPKALLVQVPLHKEHFNEESITPISEEVARHCIDNIFNILEAHYINLVLMPELSVPEKLLDIIIEKSRKFKDTLFVAGSHYRLLNDKSKPESKIAVAPVIYRGRVWYVEKIRPTAQEEKVQKVTQGTKLYYFENTPAGNVGVFICSDFITKRVNHVYESYGIKDMDALCVLACQQISRSRHHLEADAYCMNSRSAPYIFYSNIYCSEKYDGQSAFFGHRHNDTRDNSAKRINQTLIESMSDNNRYMIIEYDPSNRRPYRNKSTEDEIYNFRCCSEQPGACAEINSCTKPKHSCYLKKKKIKLVAFGLDDTLIFNPVHHYSWYHVFRELGIDDTVRKKFKDEFLEKYDRLTRLEDFNSEYQKWCNKVLRAFKEKQGGNIPIEVFRNIAKRYSLRPGVAELLRKLKENGKKLVLISGGINLIGEFALGELWDEFDDVYINFLSGDTRFIHTVNATRYDFKYKVAALELACSKFNVCMEREAAYVGGGRNAPEILANAALGILAERNGTNPMKVPRWKTIEYDDNLLKICDFINEFESSHFS